LVFLLLFIVGATAFLFYFKYLLRAPTNNITKEIKVEDGESKAEIALALESKGLIKSSWALLLYLKFKQINLQAGDYMIPGGLTTPQVAEILKEKSHQVIWITIPEGWRREQIAVNLNTKLGLSVEEFLEKTENLEGKLFPDTFKLSDQPTVDEVAKKMTDDYETRTKDLLLTEKQLILASIVEREAGNDVDRPLIAGVFANRMKIGMKLESNPTVEFQKDSNNYPESDIMNYKFWRVLVSGDVKNTAGPYNTYTYADLPPGPICNPGIKSIEAVQSPVEHDYMYFIYGNDGKLYLAKTQTEHLSNVNKYLR